jgi:hypothetical protein
MPFVPVAETVLAEIRMTLDSQEIENTLYFGLGATPAVGAMVTLTNDLFDWWTGNIAPQMSDQVQLREIVLTSLETATGPQVSFSPPTAETGALSSPVLPSNVAITVSFRTALRGRSFRGRNYFPGLTDSQVSGNTVSSVSVLAIRDAYAALLASPVADDGQWVAVSRFSGVDPVTGLPIPRVAGVATPITSVVVVDATVDSQRRRLPGRGR